MIAGVGRIPALSSKSKRSAPLTNARARVPGESSAACSKLDSERGRGVSLIRKAISPARREGGDGGLLLQAEQHWTDSAIDSAYG